MRFCSIWAEVDDFVFGVKSCGRVGEGDRFESGEDEVSWVVDEMFGFSWRSAELQKLGVALGNAYKTC